MQQKSLFKFVSVQHSDTTFVVKRNVSVHGRKLRRKNGGAHFTRDANALTRFSFAVAGSDDRLEDARHSPRHSPAQTTTTGEGKERKGEGGVRDVKTTIDPTPIGRRKYTWYNIHLPLNILLTVIISFRTSVVLPTICTCTVRRIHIHNGSIYLNTHGTGDADLNFEPHGT